MDTYAKILRDIKNFGSYGAPARENLPSTKILIDCEIRIFDYSLPILQRKTVFFDKVLHELIWFLKGDTNIKYLIDNDVNIWNEDAYKYYLGLCEEQSLEAYDYNDWLVAIENNDYKMNHVHSLYHNAANIYHKDGSLYKMGDCGRIYGYQWRDYGSNNYMTKHGTLHNRTSIDQITNLINSLKTSPSSRYHIVDAWNPQDKEEGLQALPACHTGFKCAVEDDVYLSLSVDQRSCDMFLGVPFNLLSYGILHRILCAFTGYKVGQFVWHGFNCHVYDNQWEAVNTYLDRVNMGKQPDKSPELVIDSSNWNTIDDIKFEDFKLIDYAPEPYIKAPLSTGLVK